MSKDPFRALFTESEYVEVKYHAVMHALRLKRDFIKLLEEEIRLQELVNIYLDQLGESLSMRLDGDYEIQNLGEIRRTLREHEKNLQAFREKHKRQRPDASVNIGG